MKTSVIGNVQIYGLNESIKAAKYPMATDTGKLTSELTDGIKSLAMSEKGAGHDNWLQGVVVQFDLTLSLKNDRDRIRLAVSVHWHNRRAGQDYTPTSSTPEMPNSSSMKMAS